VADIRNKNIELDMKRINDTRSYQRTKMQKDMIIQKLKEKGCRITKQRIMILDIILENECSCCKEIYFKASGLDHSIGIATIYRLINTLEEIGAIDRRNMYKVEYSKKCIMENSCTIILDDETKYHLSAQKWNDIIKAGLAAGGYITNQNIASITMKEFECSGMA
jgi:Fur family ferric uptake transcriptional regulator